MIHVGIAPLLMWFTFGWFTFVFEVIILLIYTLGVLLALNFYAGTSLTTAFWVWAPLSWFMLSITPAVLGSPQLMWKNASKTVKALASYAMFLAFAMDALWVTWGAFGITSLPSTKQPIAILIFAILSICMGSGIGLIATMSAKANPKTEEQAGEKLDRAIVPLILGGIRCCVNVALAIIVCINVNDTFSRFPDGYISPNLKATLITLPTIMLFFTMIWAAIMPSLWLPVLQRDGALSRGDVFASFCIATPQIALDAIRIASFASNPTSITNYSPTLQANASLSVLDLSLITTQLLIGWFKAKAPIPPRWNDRDDHNHVALEHAFNKSQIHLPPPAQYPPVVPEAVPQPAAAPDGAVAAFEPVPAQYEWSADASAPPAEYEKGVTEPPTTNQQGLAPPANADMPNEYTAPGAVTNATFD